MTTAPSDPEQDEAEPTRSVRSAACAVSLFLILEALVVAQFISAHQQGLLTYSQFTSRGLEGGLPLIWHFGVWSDGLMLSGLLAWLVLQYFDHWRVRDAALGFAAALTTTSLAVWGYTLSDLPEGHVVDNMLTVAGWIHAVYMTLALTIIVIFFVSRPKPLQSTRVTVSVLLVVHVFVGTHMLLGLVSVGQAIPWYVQQPLASAQGWITVVAAALALLIANLGLNASANLAKTALKRGLDAYAYIVGQRVDSARNFLTFLDDSVAQLLAIVVFFGIAIGHVVRGANPLLIILVFLVGVTWYMSRLSVKHELYIVGQIFPSDRVPDDLTPGSRLKITLQVLVFTLSYFALAALSVSVQLVSLCLLVIGVIDFWTRHQINVRFESYFSSSEYSPEPTDRDAEAIEARRHIVRWYLFTLPHLLKEALRIGGFGLALTLSLIAWQYSSQLADNLAYLALIFTLLANEIVTARWRIKRDFDLASAGSANR